MCESVGTRQLYKGYINENTISWDNGMADASVVLVGNQLEFDYPSLDYIKPTLYNRGSCLVIVMIQEAEVQQQEMPCFGLHQI